MLKILFSLLCLQMTLAQASLQSQTEALMKKHAFSATPEIKATMKRFFEELKAKNITGQAVGVGAKAPSFDLVGQKGSTPFSKLLKNGPVLVNFYRGGWCSYCMLELKEYEKLQAQFKNLGVQIIGLTPDTLSEIEKTRKKQGISFPIYRDADNKIAKQFGIAFKMNQEITGLYKKFGIDLSSAQGNSANELPLPGIYLVDSNGLVAYSYLDIDYRKRAEPQSLLTYAYNNFSAPMAKDFSLQAASGKTIDLRQYRGKKVVLEWLNHGCPFVKKHYQSNNMQAIQEKYTQQDVVWLSVISSAPGKQGYSTPEQALADQKKHQSKATEILLDPSGEVGKLYGAKTTPHMYIVNEVGRLVYQGAIDSIPSADKSDVDKANNFVTLAIDSLKGGRKIASKKTRPYGCSVKYQ
jgi:peroxiredoxin